MTSFRKILCPMDFNKSSLRAVEAAGVLAAHFGSELLLLHVVSPAEGASENAERKGADPADERALEASAQKALQVMSEYYQAQGLNTRFLVLPGNAADEIIRTADREDVELIVLANGSLPGLARPASGSLADKVVRLAKRPVLTVGR